MERLMPVVTLFLTFCASSCLGPLTSQNSGEIQFQAFVFNGGQGRMLRQGINAAQGASSGSASAMQDINNSALRPVESAYANNDATMVSGDSPSRASSAVRASSSDYAVAPARCAISRRIGARRQLGRIRVIPNTDSQQTCCELCRETPNSACRSWYRSNWFQTSRCYLNSFA